MLPNNTLLFGQARETFEEFDTEYFDLTNYKAYDVNKKLCTMRYRQNENTHTLEITREDGDVLSIPIVVNGLVNNVSLAYDQSNRPIYSYSYTDKDSNKSISKFVWFNQLTNKEETVIIEDTSMSYVIIDEVRKVFVEDSDIVFFYVRRSDSKLCFRYQRDSFRTEYVGPVMTKGEEIAKVGRANTNRLQLETLKVLYRLVYGSPCTFNNQPLLLADGNPIWIVKEKIRVSAEE